MVAFVGSGGDRRKQMGRLSDGQFNFFNKIILRENYLWYWVIVDPNDLIKRFLKVKWNIHKKFYSSDSIRFFKRV